VTVPDFKGPGRIVDPAAVRRKLVLDPTCRSCDEPASNGHHLVPRSLRGDDVEANVVPLCGTGTTGCHGEYENHGSDWGLVAASIRASLTEAELEYVLEKKGADFLARYYPPRMGPA
jgi:hypothetical protein